MRERRPHTADANFGTVVFTGGGTGGHIYPGLAVAGAFRVLNAGARIVWIGSSGGMDRTLVEKSGLADAFYGIPSGKLRRYFSLKIIPDVIKIAAGVISSIFLLVRLKPRAVFSKGGYVSVPPCFASRLLGIPVYTHECDFSPGLATRLNSRAASRVFVSYEGTAAFFPASMRDRVTVTGNPVRAQCYAADAQKGRRFLGISATDKPVLLVIGGSSGSAQINALVAHALPRLTEHFFVAHQTGFGADGKAVAQNADAPDYRGFAFIYGEMCDVIAAADVVVSRAGANFLSECAVCAKPLVLIPLAGSGTRGDQVENAAYFAQKGAALVLDGKTVTADDLVLALETMLDPAARAAFSKAAHALVPDPHPAEVIASIMTQEVFSS
jgi:UDP-N-acetylglucosamine--N-acetylmuramyl-(pentapeptide) pyrophosphoryl-undecaprenol N-acetylglucosamine transferase